MKTSTMDANVNEKGPTGHQGTTGFADTTMPSGSDKRSSVTTTTTTTQQPQNLQSSQFNQSSSQQSQQQQQHQFQRRENQLNLFWRRAKDGFQQVKRKVEDYSSDIPMSKYAVPLLLLAVFLALWANGSMQGLKDKLVPQKTLTQQFTETVQNPPQQVCFPVPNTDNVKNMMPNTGNMKDYVPNANTVKNMMPDAQTAKDAVKDTVNQYMPNANTVKNMMPDTEAAKESIKETVNQYIPNANTVKNMMPDTEAAKESIKDTVNQYIPNADTVKEKVNQYIPNADSVKNMMPNSETFKNMMPNSNEQQYKTQQIKTEIIQEFPVPKQAAQDGSKQYRTHQTFDSAHDSSSTFSEKLSQAGEAIKAGYDRVKEKVAGTTGNE